MTQLRLDYQKFIKVSTEIMAVGPENAEVFKRFWDKEALPFSGLPDPRHEVASLYGQEGKVLKLGRLPAQMIIDKSGMLRYAHYGTSMSDIPSNREILTILEKVTSDMS